MQTIKTVGEITADGSLKLISPLPAGLKLGRIEMLVVIHEESAPHVKAKRQIPVASPEMLAARKAALQDLRNMGGLKDVIPDPLAWQREIRQDVVLPGRE